MKTESLPFKFEPDCIAFFNIAKIHDTATLNSIPFKVLGDWKVWDQRKSYFNTHYLDKVDLSKATPKDYVVLNIQKDSLDAQVFLVYKNAIEGS